MREKWNEVIRPGLIIVGAIAIFVYIAIFLITDASAEEMPPTFDHTDCQYPFRLSNPVNGCDNTDPACLAEMKGGVCDADGDQQPVFSPIVAPVASQAVVSEPTPVKRGCYE